MKIAYCEDEPAQAALTADRIRDWAKCAGVECELDMFRDAEHFLFELGDTIAVPYDLVLLDISMREMDGFSLARKLREKDKQVRIAFLTSDPGYVFEGYEIQAWRYILKPLDEKKVAEMMNALVQTLQLRERSYLVLDVSGEKVKLFLDEIQYVEVNGHYTTIHCDGKEHTVKENFKDMVKRLNDEAGREDDIFVKCHRSAAVNICRVQCIGKQSCTLEDGFELAVSRGMYQSLNQAFIKENL